MRKPKSKSKDFTTKSVNSKPKIKLFSSKSTIFKTAPKTKLSIPRLLLISHLSSMTKKKISIIRFEVFYYR